MSAGLGMRCEFDRTSGTQGNASYTLNVSSPHESKLYRRAKPKIANTVA